jgi:heme iron utilization protein
MQVPLKHIPRMPVTDPVQPADPAACALGRRLISTARFAALAVTDPDTRTPGISRIAFGVEPGGGLLSLVSSLSAHHRALIAAPECALMVGEPTAGKGDPLTHPRLMIQCRAAFVGRLDPDHTTIRDSWLKSHPKSKLYIDFADFSFVRFSPFGVTQVLVRRSGLRLQTCRHEKGGPVDRPMLPF